MVFIRDEGSTFDAPVDHVWKYMSGDDRHDKAHKSTRGGKFQSLSDVTIMYTTERNFRGAWSYERMRISIFPPVSIVQEVLEGPLEGSKMVYVYSPKGSKTQIDVFGDFRIKGLPDDQVEAAARAWLESEYNEDAPVIRESYQKK